MVNGKKRSGLKILAGSGVLLAALAIIGACTFILLKPIKKDAAEYVAPKTPTVQTSARKLVFDDEFNGTQLNSSVWNTCYDNYSTQYKGCTNLGNYESEWYTAGQVSESGGNLVLTAQKQTTKGVNRYGGVQDYQYTSGMITTGGANMTTPAKWSGTYGYYEARVDAPSGKAMWPAFWLLPADHKWPPEIDVVEMLGDKPDQALTTYYWPGAADQNQPKDSSTYTASSSLMDSWHIFAVDWEPGTITWYVDGKVVKHVEGPNVPTQGMQIIFDLAVGGLLPGYPDTTTPATAKMLVDYIRVYKN